MLPFVGHFLYKCNDCGKTFDKPKKIPLGAITVLNAEAETQNQLII